jgi:REP element-mobilizing transposase RayT
MYLPNTEELYRYIWGILKSNNCTLYQINGTENHLHIVSHIHPSVAISSLVKDIKISSSNYIKSKGIFPDFDAWQGGYGAFTYHTSLKNTLVNYVKNQREHHRKTTFREEYIELLEEHGVEYNPIYLI